MPMEIPRLHSRDTTAPWNFYWLHPVKYHVANMIWENCVPKWESIGAPWTNLDTLSVSYPEPEGLAFKAVRCQCYLTSAVVRPAAQSVMAAGWFGTSRATQATREGVTDLWFKIQSKFIWWLSAAQESGDQDGERWGPPLASSPHLTWGKIRVLSVQLRKVECCMILFH